MDSSSRPRRHTKGPNFKQPSTNAVNNTLQPAAVVMQYRRIDDDTTVERENRAEPKQSYSGKREDANSIEKVVDIIRQHAQESKRTNPQTPKGLQVNQPSSSKSPPQARGQFKAFGIEAYPTRALQNEICRDFIFEFLWCRRGNYCYRIHPKDKSYYISLLHEARDETRSVSQDATANEGQDNVGTEATKTDIEIPQDPVLKVKLPPSSSEGPDWNIAGVWQTFPDAEAWTDSSSSSGDSTQDSSRFSSGTSSSRTSVAGDSESSFKTVTINTELQSRKVCWGWLHGKCSRGTCFFSHREDDNGFNNDKFPSLPQTSSEIMGFPRFRQREAQFCNDWLRGYCPRGLACSYVHEDKRKDYVNSELARISTKPPRPKFNERCRDWLRDQCSRGASCPYVHEDIDYDDSRNQLDDGTHSRPRVPSDRPSGYIPRKPPEVLHFKVHDHIKIGLRAGFEIQQVVTGFESSWLFISNVPSNVTQENIMRLLRRHGTITDAREIPEARMSTSTFKIRMSSTAEASQACANLNGTKEFGTTIAARLSVTNSSTGNAILCDTSVRITWELPGKVAYAGYPNHERAYEAIRKIRFPFGDAFVRADIHSGLPAVGAVTVRFEGIPVEADESDMRHFAEPEDVVWERPNYKSLGGAVAGIKRFLQLDGVNLIGFELKPPPYKDARALAWAHYATPSDAKVACDNLNHRKPTCTGMTRINARHVKSISYSLNANTYGRLSKDIDNLRRTAWHNSTTVSVIELPSAAHVTVKLCSEDLQKLGRLKMEMESILTGEVVRRDGKIAWDGFFGSSVGFMFLQELQRRYFGMNVERNTARRMIRLFGPLLGRRAVREEILRKIDQLHSQRVHVVRIEGRLIGIFMSAELMKLQERLGPENVILDVWNRCLRIRGDEDAYVEAREIVDAARQRHTLDRGNQQGVMCPVCLDAVTFPISLQCGHTWCRSCLKNYLEAAKSQKLFPLTCLGDEARCSMRIPLGVARDILPIADFEELAHAAFSAHVHSHPEEFHFCPTPDCAQVYRTANIANGALIQCPSCLVRICSKCHAEAHEGLACIDGDDDGQFKEWAKAHDVKNCPGCNIPIERVEGCNHVTCTRCQTHTCWVCMATFPGGEGIYGHMRTAHGGFGLGPTE